MKKVFKKILQYYLKYLAKLALFIYRPTVIAVAGSVNKTFVKDAIQKALGKEGINTRSNPGGFNTEIGLPLAILNLPSGYNSYEKWYPIILKSLKSLWQNKFPDFLVLELGVSDSGDMKYLLSIIKPKITVITDITQRYLEGFGDIENLIKEYSFLVKKTKKDGLVLLNQDNENVKNLANFARAKVELFGTQGNPDWQAVDIEKNNNGQTVKIKHNNSISQFQTNRFGQHHVYSLLISSAVKNYVKQSKKK